MLPIQTPRLSTPFQRLLALGLVLLFGLGGCGSVTAASNLGDAQRQLDEARGQQADQYAIYEYTRAYSYLQKAKKLHGEGLYEQSSEYAHLSQSAADKALDVARMNKDREKRREKFAPKKRDEARPLPVKGGAPSGEE